MSDTPGPLDPAPSAHPPTVLAQRWAGAAPDPLDLAEPDLARAGRTDVAIADLEGRPVAISHTGAETVIRLRDLTDGRPLRDIELPTDVRVGDMHVADLGGVPVAVTSDGATVRVWNLATGEDMPRIRTDRRLAPIPPGGLFIIATGDDTAPRSLATTMLRGRPVVLTAAGFNARSLWIYDLATGEPCDGAYIDGGLLGASLVTEHAAGSAVFASHPIVLISNPRQPRKVRAYDLRTREWRGEVPTHTHAALAVELDGHLAVVTARKRGAQVWDLTTGEQRGHPLTGHRGGVTAMVATTLRNRPTLITAGDDHLVRVWDLTSGDTLATATVARPASSLAVRDDTVVCGLGNGIVGPDVVALELGETLPDGSVTR